MFEWVSYTDILLEKLDCISESLVLCVSFWAALHTKYFRCL
jgi:hypothetical protein